MAARVRKNLSESFWREALRLQFTYSFLGLVLGGLCIVGGVALTIGGATETTAFTARILGSETTLSDATAGVVLMVLGLLVVFVTRFTLGED